VGGAELDKTHPQLLEEIHLTSHGPMLAPGARSSYTPVRRCDGCGYEAIAPCDPLIAQSVQRVSHV